MRWLAAFALCVLAWPAVADMFPNAGNATPEARRNLGIAAYPPVADDLDPRRHFSNLIGKSAATICIVGDSTMTAGPAGGNAVDPSQMLWGAIQQKFIKDNPQITSWEWGNYSIGATTENQFVLPGSSIASVTNAPWFTDLSKTWEWYIANHTRTTNSCDVLFYGFGTNAASAGVHGGSTAALFIRDNMAAFERWAYKPNLIQVTTKTQRGDVDADDNDFYKLAQAGFHRTFAQSNAAGYTLYPNMRSMGIGLLDLGRSFASRVLGYDPAIQYMEARPDCLQTGFALGTTSSLVLPGDNTVCVGAGGDYRMTMVLPLAGGTVLGGYGGTALRFTGGSFEGNYLRLTWDAAGTITPRWIITGSTAAPLIVGTPTATTLGQDVTLTISQAGGRVQLWICGTLATGVPGGQTNSRCGDLRNLGTLAFDAIVPRFTNAPAAGQPVNVAFSTAPSGSPAANIIEFWDSHPITTTSIIFASEAFGDGTSLCSAANAGCRGGNFVNHIDSISTAHDRAAIDAMDFHVPSIPPAQNLVFNPSMEVDQINGGDAVAYLSSTGGWCIDNWHPVLVATNGQTATCRRSATNPPPGETDSLLATITAAGATGTNDYMRIVTMLPADVVAKLEWGTTTGKSAYVTYQIRSSLVGQYSFVLRSPNDTAVYHSTCYIGVADTWTKCSVNIPAPLMGTWISTGAATGIKVQWVLAAGAGFATQAIGWDPTPSASSIAVTGQAQLSEVMGATFQLGKVKIEVGNAPTPYQKPSLIEELSSTRLGQYAVKSYEANTKTGSVTEVGSISWIAASAIGSIPITIRQNCGTTPVIHIYNPALGTFDRVQDVTAAATVIATAADVGTSGFKITFTAIDGHEYRAHWRALCQLL